MKALRNCGLAVAGILVVAAVVTILLVSGEGDPRELPQSAAELEARKAAADTAQDRDIDADLHDFGAQCSAPEDAEEGRTWSCSVEPQGAGQCFGTVRIVATGSGSARREDDEIECGE